MKFFRNIAEKIILFSFVSIASVLLIAYPVLAASPTPDDPISEVSRGNIPAGWTLAGLLILVLLFMIYQQVRNFLRRVIRKTKKKTNE